MFSYPLSNQLERKDPSKLNYLTPMESFSLYLLLLNIFSITILASNLNQAETFRLFS